MGTISNRVTEKDIRDWLDKNGYFGRSARVEELELHAIARPGWIQIYRFRLEAKTRDGNDLDSPAQWHDLFGIVKDDERKKSLAARTEILIFSLSEDRQQKLDELSSGMITCQPSQNAGLFAIGLGMAAIISAFYVVAQLI